MNDKRTFFKKLAMVIESDMPNRDHLSNSVIAFFIEDFLFELEEQNELINLKDDIKFQRHSQALLSKFKSNEKWVSVLNLEVKYQQKIISILEKKPKQSIYDGQLAEVESAIAISQPNKNSNHIKQELESLSTLIHRYIALQEAITFEGYLSKSETDERSELVAKTLQSALPFNDMTRFASLDFNQKKEHLMELHLIHTGITIFKHEYEQCKMDLAKDQQSRLVTSGPNIPYIESFSDETFGVQNQELIHLIEEIENKDCNEMDFDEQVEIKLIWQKFIQIKNFLDSEFQVLLNLRNKGHSEIEQLIELANKPNQTLKNVIFPVFSELGSTLKSLLLSKSKIVSLFEFVSSFKEFINKKILTLKSVEANEKETSLKDPMMIENDRFKFIASDNLNFSNIKLGFNGVCLVSLVCDGIILYGNPSEGVLYDKVKNMHLCFFSLDKIYEFMKGPDEVYEHACQSLQDYKMLMFLMDYERLQKYRFFIDTINDELKDENLKCYNVGIQTPVHMLEKFIDHNYFWNEWDLRRQAIKMANIRNKKTIGCQTGNSYFKVNNETQIWPMKDQTTMTELEKGTNPIWPRNYIVGLRSVDNK